MSVFSSLLSWISLSSVDCVSRSYLAETDARGQVLGRIELRLVLLVVVDEYLALLVVDLLWLVQLEGLEREAGRNSLQSRWILFDLFFAHKEPQTVRVGVRDVFGQERAVLVRLAYVLAQVQTVLQSLLLRRFC